jgi:hypothetical protein
VRQAYARLLNVPVVDPMYDLVRRSPRFVALLRRANFDLRLVEKPIAPSNGARP